MITYHLADSLPEKVLERLRLDVEVLPREQRDAALRVKIEEWADAGHGSCVLRHPQIAEMVIENWKHYDGQRYALLAYVVMPNHVHVLIRTGSLVPMYKVVQAWKGYSGKKIQEFRNTKSGIAGQTAGVPRQAVWHREYWDRYIRDEHHFRQAVNYIIQNPVKAGLVKLPEEWPWSSASGNAVGAPAGSAGRPVG